MIVQPGCEPQITSGGYQNAETMLLVDGHQNSRQITKRKELACVPKKVPMWAMRGNDSPPKG